MQHGSVSSAHATRLNHSRSARGLQWLTSTSARETLVCGPRTRGSGVRAMDFLRSSRAACVALLAAPLMGVASCAMLAGLKDRSLEDSGVSADGHSRDAAATPGADADYDVTAPDGPPDAGEPALSQMDCTTSGGRWGTNAIATGACDWVFASPGTYPWNPPANTTSVSVVCVGGGGGSLNQTGGGGGGLGWINDFPVTLGMGALVTVGGGGGSGLTSGMGQDSSLFSSMTVPVRGGGGGPGDTDGEGNTEPGAPGDYDGMGGGYGGAGASQGGGGAGGYTGAGGDSGYPSGEPGAGGGGGAGAPTELGYSGGGGGGVGLYGALDGGSMQTTPGSGGFGGSGGTSGANAVEPPGMNPNGIGTGGNGGGYGGGGGAGTTVGGNGANGGCRIVWPGSVRQFPNTLVSAP